MLYLINKKQNLLTKKVKFFIIHRNSGLLMHVGKIVSGAEKESAAHVLFMFKRYLKKGPMTTEDMIELTMYSAAINAKIAQHLLPTAFPTFEFPQSILQSKVPKALIFASNNKNNLLNWDQILSGINMVHKNMNPLFKEGKMISLPNREKGAIFSKDCQQYQNTKQHEPDFLYKYSKGENGEVIWNRYYDWKTGEISPNSGHLFGTSDPILYEKLSEELLIRQTKIYLHNAKLGPFLQELKKMNLTWSDKNLLFQEYMIKNMQNFGHDINPSLIFKSPLFKNAENLWRSKSYKQLESSLAPDSFADRDSTEMTIAKIMIKYEKKPDILENYLLTQGHSTFIGDFCRKIIQDFDPKDI